MCVRIYCQLSRDTQNANGLSLIFVLWKWSLAQRKVGITVGLFRYKKCNVYFYSNAKMSISFLRWVSRSRYTLLIN